MANLPTLTEIFFGDENPATFVPWYSDSAKATKVKKMVKSKKKMITAPTKSTTINMS